MKFRLMLLSAMVAATTAAASAADSQQHIRYYHMWADKTGTTHIATCSFKNFELQQLSSGDSPQYSDTIGTSNDKTIFTIQPSGWTSDWHKNPAVQWVVPLSGTWYVRMSDGHVQTMGPGDVALGEDQMAMPAPSGEDAGKTGHAAGNVGREAVKLMIVQTDWVPTVGQPCHVK